MFSSRSDFTICLPRLFLLLALLVIVIVVVIVVMIVIAILIFLVFSQVHDNVMRNRAAIDAEIQHERDFSFDYFGFKVKRRTVRSRRFRINLDSVGAL